MTARVLLQTVGYDWKADENKWQDPPHPSLVLNIGSRWLRLDNSAGLP